jgi:hypothetical protein
LKPKGNVTGHRGHPFHRFLWCKSSME